MKNLSIAAMLVLAANAQASVSNTAQSEPIIHELSAATNVIDEPTKIAFNNPACSTWGMNPRHPDWFLLGCN